MFNRLLLFFDNLIILFTFYVSYFMGLFIKQILYNSCIFVLCIYLISIEFFLYEVPTQYIMIKIYVQIIN